MNAPLPPSAPNHHRARKEDGSEPRSSSPVTARTGRLPGSATSAPVIWTSGGSRPPKTCATPGRCHLAGSGQPAASHKRCACAGANARTAAFKPCSARSATQLEARRDPFWQDPREPELSASKKEPASRAGSRFASSGYFLRRRTIESPASPRPSSASVAGSGTGSGGGEMPGAKVEPPYVK